MRSKKKVLAVVLVNAAVAVTFFATQNCGRVNIAAPLEVQKASLSVSVSSELVIKVQTNKAEIFAVPTASGSSDISALSFDPNTAYLETMTDLRGSLSINPETWNITYTPAVGLIGNDRTTLYVTGSDQKQIAVTVAFLVGNESTSGSEQLNALVYGDSPEDRLYLTNKLSGYAPPGMSEIFNRWQRISGDRLYASAAKITTLPSLAFCNSGVNMTTGVFNNVINPATGKSESPSGIAACMNDPAFIATSWVLMPSPERIFCAANAGLVTGFISPLSFENYTHEATLSSKSGDDDGLGLIMAFARDEAGNNHVLAATRTQGGIGLGSGAAALSGWGIGYYKNGTLVKVVGYKPVGPVPTNKTQPYQRNADGSYKLDATGKKIVKVAGTGDFAGWKGRSSKVKVIRAGSMFTIFASPYGDATLTLDPASQLVVDVSNKSLGLEVFLGARPYGYMSYSQVGSDYRDVKFSSGAVETYVYDLPNKIIYEKQASGSFRARTDLDAFTHIGAPRKVGNPDTGKLFQLNANKTFELLN